MATEFLVKLPSRIATKRTFQKEWGKTSIVGCSAEQTNSRSQLHTWTWGIDHSRVVLLEFWVDGPKRSVKGLHLILQGFEAIRSTVLETSFLEKLNQLRLKRRDPEGIAGCRDRQWGHS
jgi:hypothetical protein